MDESICTRSCECRAIPSVLIAGGYVVGCVVVLTNVEVEGVRARTPFDVCIIISVGTTLVVAYIVPSVLFAGILMEGVMSAVMDYEVKSVNIGAS